MKKTRTLGVEKLLVMIKKQDQKSQLLDEDIKQLKNEITECDYKITELQGNEGENIQIKDITSSVVIVMLKEKGQDSRGSIWRNPETDVRKVPTAEAE